MMVRIVSDEGIGLGSRIIDQKTGAEIRGAVGLEVSIRLDDINRAQVELGSVAVDIVAMADFRVKDPRSGDLRRVARIVFADDKSDADWSAS